MRITEIFALGRYGRSDGCYCGGHYHRHDHEKRYRHGGYGRRSLSDRDTPLARLKGSSTF